MLKVRPEQLGWGLVSDLAITASGNYFIFDTSGSVTLDFKGVNNNSFLISTTGSTIFQVKDNGEVTIPGNLTVGGTLIANITGSFQNALTASHLEEQNISTFRPIQTPQMFITGGLFRSSSGDWFLS